MTVLLLLSKTSGRSNIALRHSTRRQRLDETVNVFRYFSNPPRVSATSSSAGIPILNNDDDDVIINNADDAKIPIPSKIKCYLDLAKARLSALVVTTTAAGFVAAGGPLSEQASVAAACVIGTALCSSSAAGWNQIIERDRDAQMKRTQQRPLVQHHLTVSEAKFAATAWGVAGTGLLYMGTDPVTAMLGLSNIGLYAGLYTYMKPRSIYNTWVGAVVGAIPPVMGWTAATGGSLLDLDAMILGTTLYLWQMPHFFALSFMHRVDYKRGGFAMLPVLESDGDRTSQMVLRYAVYLSTVPLVATYMDVTSSMFALEGVALNTYALYVAHKFRQERTNANARKVFLTSLWYLPTWLVLFLLHSKVWDEEHDKDVLRDAVSNMVHTIRDQGRQICLHEQAIAQNPVVGEDKCPVSLTRKTSAVVQQATEAVSNELQEQKA
jgi:protoheme IX farnesyltransferase